MYVVDARVLCSYSPVSAAFILDFGSTILLGSLPLNSLPYLAISSACSVRRLGNYKCHPLPSHVEIFY